MTSLEAHPLVHRVREPTAGADGTLVLLHGRGADEHDLFGLFDVLDPERRLRGVTIGAPFRLPPGGKHWYIVPRVGFPEPRTFHHSLQALGDLLDGELGIDPTRTVIGGFSQGAVMSFALGLHPDRPAPAGILGMSGFVPTVDGWRPDVEARPHLPVLIAHGTMDPVISVEFAHQARALLEAGGLPVTYRESPMPHTIDPRVIPDIAGWLAERLPAAAG